MISAKKKEVGKKRFERTQQTRREGSKPRGCLRENILSRRNSHIKGPEVGRCRLCSRKSKKASGARRGRVINAVGENRGRGWGLPEEYFSKAFLDR